MDFIITKLTAKSADQLAILNKQLIEDEGNAKDLSHHYLCQRMKNWLKDERYFGFGIEIEEQMKAYLLACYEDDFVYLRQLVTDREYRCHGMASALIAHLEKFVGPSQQLRLDVLMSNKNAMYFYAKLGFQPFYMAMLKNTL
ncbi:GNAT family N-acetyltransferase [Celerinatantimonas diazotrophica]|nr:GNAT family N-acetyltransferase [Celerinatantimonas diazotrophica]